MRSPSAVEVAGRSAPRPEASSDELRTEFAGDEPGDLVGLHKPGRDERGDPLDGREQDESDAFGIARLQRDQRYRGDEATLIDLARRLEIKTVAEWVQDDESAAMLRDWGCDYIQGRLIGLASTQRPWDSGADVVLPAAAS